VAGVTRLSWPVFRGTAGPAVVALLAGFVLAGCGNAPGSTAPPPAGAAAASERPSGGTSEPAAPVGLPWPADGAADAAALQAAADAGSQPWLLDPSEVAIAYAAAAHGCTRGLTAPASTSATPTASASR
jgi:hypothetical protein